MRKTDPIGLAKAILWEEAKGKLRALVAAEGAAYSDYHGQGDAPFQKIEAVVETFISEFEADGHHE